MNMDKTTAFLILFIGMLIGALFTIVIMINVDGYYKQSFEAIELCEKDLPRSQHCTITAIKIEE